MDLNFLGGAQHSLEETTRYLGVSRERVRQIERRALEKLRVQLEKRYGITCVSDVL